MAEWRVDTLGNFANIEMGQSPESEYYNYSGEGMPFLQGSKTFGERHPSVDMYCTALKKTAEEGSILFSVRAPVGDINIADKKICIGRGLSSLTAKNNQNHYLFYLLKCLRSTILSLESGSVFGSVNRTNLMSIKFSLPPLSEQKAIAEVLSSLDDKIDLLRRQNKTLEAIAQALFKKWIMDSADTAEKKLSGIYQFKKGCEPGSKYYAEEKAENAMRFIRVGDMLDSAGKTYVDSDLLPATCDFSDLLVSFDGTVGRIAFGVEGGYSSGIRKITSNDAVFDNFGLKYLIFSSKHVRNIIQQHATGTVILHAGSAIGCLTFDLPGREEIKKFQATSDEIFKKILKNLSEIRTMENLRDALLPELISGKIRLKEAGGR